MANEHVIVDAHAFADKRVARDLAVRTDDGVLLDFDKGANLGVGADLTPVKVDEAREFDTVGELVTSGAMLRYSPIS